MAYAASAKALAPEAKSGEGAVDVLMRWNDNRNGRITREEARAHGIAPVHRGHPAYLHMKDGDGVVCE